VASIPALERKIKEFILKVWLDSWDTGFCGLQEKGSPLLFISFSIDG
jgi:hypothetical protein